MKYSRLAILLAIVLATPMATTVSAADLSTPAAPVQARATGGYLGVLLEPVPDELRAQMGDSLPLGQGVMIRNVSDDSPAAKAGLKDYDILINFNDQKLFSVDQLRQLVRSEAPDTIVTLRVLRGGTVLDTQATLGEAQAVSESGYPELRMPMHKHRAGPPAMLPDTGGSNWDSFDSMSLKKLEDGNFKAEIQFLGKDGKMVTQDFTGTRDSIREQILDQRDLPRPERNQLLAALSARDEFFPYPMPPNWVVPEFYFPPWFNWQPQF